MLILVTVVLLFEIIYFFYKIYFWSGVFIFKSLVRYIENKNFILDVKIF